MHYSVWRLDSIILSLVVHRTWTTPKSFIWQREENEKTRRYRGETSKTERNDFFFIIPMTYGMKPLWLSGLRYKGRKTGGFTWKSEIIFSLVARSLARTTRSAQATACAVDRIGGYYDVNATKMRRVATFVTRKTQWVNDILDDATPRSRKS